MKELELKHIAPYLPHGLGVVTDDGIREKTSLVNIKNGELTIQDYSYPLKWIKPLLRPMSDLFENIVHNGEIVCVAKLINDQSKDLRFFDDAGCYMYSEPL